MAKKITPEELRKQAQNIMNKAKKLETEENARIGAAIRDIAKAGFNIGYEDLKARVYELLNMEEKLSTGNPTQVSLTGGNDKGNA